MAAVTSQHIKRRWKYKQRLSLNHLRNLYLSWLTLTPLSDQFFFPCVENLPLLLFGDKLYVSLQAALTFLFKCQCLSVPLFKSNASKGAKIMQTDSRCVAWPKCCYKQFQRTFWVVIHLRPHYMQLNSNFIVKSCAGHAKATQIQVDVCPTAVINKAMRSIRFPWTRSWLIPLGNGERDRIYAVFVMPLWPSPQGTRVRACLRGDQHTHILLIGKNQIKLIIIL